MGCHPWETDEEHHWLLSLTPKFLDAQRSRTVSDFWSNVYTSYFAKFGYPEVTNSHMTAAKFDPEKPEDQQVEAQKLAKEQRHNQIQSFFYRKTNTSSKVRSTPLGDEKGTVTMTIESIKAPTKKRRLQKRYAWAKVFYDEAAKQEFSELYRQAIASGALANGKTAQTNFRNKFFSDKYNACSSADKARIEQFRESHYLGTIGEFGLLDTNGGSAEEDGGGGEEEEEAREGGGGEEGGEGGGEGGGGDHGDTRARTLSQEERQSLLVNHVRKSMHDLRNFTKDYGRFAVQNGKQVGWIIMAGPNPDAMDGLHITSYAFGSCSTKDGDSKLVKLSYTNMFPDVYQMVESTLLQFAEAAIPKEVQKTFNVNYEKQYSGTAQDSPERTREPSVGPQSQFGGGGVGRGEVAGEANEAQLPNAPMSRDKAVLLTTKDRVTDNTQLPSIDTLSPTMTPNTTKDRVTNNMQPSATDTLSPITTPNTTKDRVTDNTQPPATDTLPPITTPDTTGLNKNDAQINDGSSDLTELDNEAAVPGDSNPAPPPSPPKGMRTRKRKAVEDRPQNTQPVRKTRRTGHSEKAESGEATGWPAEGLAVLKMDGGFLYPEWLRLLDLWEKYEKSRSGSSTKRKWITSVRNRPPEFKYWNDYGQTDPIGFARKEKFDAFKEGLLDWWTEVMPQWRKDNRLGLTAARSPPPAWKPDWKTVDVPGRKGLYQFISGAVWWKTYELAQPGLGDDTENRAWFGLVDDISWILEQLIGLD